MKNKDRKKKQRAVNKAVRKINQCIENDSLWLGRFYVHQIAAKYRRYEDNSGGMLFFTLEFIDRKTNLSNISYFEYYGTDPFLVSNLFWAMNDFIVNDCKVWERENPYEEIVDYKKRKKNI